MNKRKKECMKALDALYLELDYLIIEDVKIKVIEALDEEYHRGYRHALDR